MARFQTLDDVDVRDKRVLLRADLNVPVKNGVVTDATRIERLAPTIEILIEKSAKVIVMSHFGRPQGRPDPAYSLRPLVAPLSRAIRDREVAFAADCIGGSLRRSGPGRSRSSKISASTRAKRRTRQILRGRWLSSAMSMSTTPSRPPIARTPRSRP
jgi:hypothetical protein